MRKVTVVEIEGAFYTDACVCFSQFKRSCYDYNLHFTDQETEAQRD